MKKMVENHIDEAKRLLRSGRGRAAIHAVENGLEVYPENPLLISYLGYLVAVVEKDFGRGISLCEDALKKLDRALPTISKEHYPSMYLNLARAHVASNNRGMAYHALREGLKIDPGNRDLEWEMKKMGTRKRPPLPFLNRNNPINKYLGILRSKMRQS